MRILPHTRTELQAMPLAALMALAHQMNAEQPNRYRTPDEAWRQLRLMIEPMQWDIRDEVMADGRWYVAYYGGEAVAMRPHGTAGAFDELCHTMQTFWDATYPRELVSGRWSVPHVAAQEAEHVN